MRKLLPEEERTLLTEDFSISGKRRNILFSCHLSDGTTCLELIKAPVAHSAGAIFNLFN